MKNIKNKFQEHRIQPSPKAWERIESELDAGKVRKMPLNWRWAAAAMLIFSGTMYFSYQSFNKIEDNTVVSKTKTEETTTPNTNSILPTTKEEVAVINNSASKAVESIKKTPIIAKVTLDKNEKIETIVSNTFEKYPLNPITKKHETISIQSLAQNNPKLISEKEKVLNILRVSEDEDYEDVAAEHFIFPKFQNSEDSDSTFTEKVLNFGQMKAKEVVSKALKLTPNQFFPRRRFSN